MKLKRKYLLVAVLVVLIAAGAYAYYEYNRKLPDLADVKPHSSISADSLVRVFETDENKANALYLGKPVNINGLVAEIINQQDTIVNITLGEKSDSHKVSCLLDANHIKDIKNYNVGDKITIRGICNGYLMDVELNRCVIINQNN